MLVVIASILILIFIAFLPIFSRSGAGESQIVQMSVSHLLPEHLYERNPIVLTDRIVRAAQVASTVFRWHYIVRRKTVCQVNKQTLNRAFFATLHARGDQTTVVRLDKHGIPSVDVVLRKDQVLIVPMRWRYTVTQGKISASEYHNVASLILLMSRV